MKKKIVLLTLTFILSLPVFASAYTTYYPLDFTMTDTTRQPSKFFTNYKEEIWAEFSTTSSSKSDILVELWRDEPAPISDKFEWSANISPNTDNQKRVFYTTESSGGKYYFKLIKWTSDGKSVRVTGRWWED